MKLRVLIPVVGAGGTVIVLEGRFHDKNGHMESRIF